MRSLQISYLLCLMNNCTKFAKFWSLDLLWAYYELNIMSTCDFINLPKLSGLLFYQYANFVNLPIFNPPFSQLAILSAYHCSNFHFINLTFCQLAIMPIYYFSFCNLSTCRSVGLPICWLAILSNRHFSLCHFVKNYFPCCEKSSVGWEDGACFAR